MKDFLIAQLIPFLDTAIVGALVLIIKEVGKEVRNYLVKKRELAEAQIKDAGKEEVVKTAWETFYEVDEKFRITDKIATFLGSKADEFDKLMLSKIPGLTQDELTSLRQAISGEINQGKAAILDQSTIIKQLQADNEALKAEKDDLTSKNKDLEDKLSSVQQDIQKNIQAVFIAKPSDNVTDTDQNKIGDASQLDTANKSVANGLGDNASNIQ